MRDTLPEWATVTVTLEDFARAQPWRRSQKACEECLVSQAFRRAFHISGALVGYDSALVFPPRVVAADGHKVGPAAVRYRWNDRRVQQVIVAYDAGNDAALARLLPLEIHVQRVS